MKSSTRDLARFLLGLECAAGAILVALLLFQHDVNRLATRTAWTSVLFIVLSLTCVAGGRLVRRRSWVGWLGMLTVLVSLCAFLLVVGTLWSGRFPDEPERSAIALLLSLALGSGSLLMHPESADDGPALLLLARRVTLLALAALATLIMLLVLEVDIGPRGVAVAAAVFLTGALSMPFAQIVSRANRLPPLPLDHLVIAISDRERSDRFYSEVLGARIEPRAEGRVSYRIGEQRLNVHQPGVAAEPLAAEPVRPGNSDLCFVWPGRPEAAVAHLRAKGVEIVEGPVPRTGARGEGTSVYCRDPDGSLIELISYSR